MLMDGLCQLTVMLIGKSLMAANLSLALLEIASFAKLVYLSIDSILLVM